MIELRNLTKTFPGPNGGVQALKDVSLTIDDGDIYGIIGMSGAGKSTLVRCINLLERPTQGTVLLDGQDLSTLSQKELRQTRRKIAMIFQGFHLLQQRTCLKNVCFPLELAGVSRAAARQRAEELLELVGLPDKAGAYPSQLSGGQQQRVAIARALATDPKVLLCDEATSALDPNTTHAILSLIRQINRQTGITVVVITHQMSVVEEICNRVAILDNGVVAETGEVSPPVFPPQLPRRPAPGVSPGRGRGAGPLPRRGPAAGGVPRGKDNPHPVNRQDGHGAEPPGQHSLRLHPPHWREGVRQPPAGGAPGQSPGSHCLLTKRAGRAGRGGDRPC